MGLCQTVVLVQSHGAVMPKLCFFPFQASVGVGCIELGERIQGGDVLVFGDEGDDGAANAQEEAADDDGPVLQQDAGHAFRETQDDDDDERNVHRHQADGHDAERDGENAEDAPHAGEHLADLVLRDGHVILAHQCGEGIADDRHREPQEVPLRLPGQIPKQVDDQGDGGEQRTPKQEVLGAVAKDALADEIVQAPRGFGDGPVGLQLDEGALGFPLGRGKTGYRDQQGGRDEKAGEEESVLFHETMLLCLTKIRTTRQKSKTP